MNLLNILTNLYESQADQTYQKIQFLIEKERIQGLPSLLTEKDVMLITYGDTIKDEKHKPLQILHHFLKSNLQNQIPNLHLLPMYPYTSDDGFSVVDYEEINSDLGSWDDIETLSKDYHLMFDGVINHISKESQWFKGYLNDDPKYKDFFILCNPNTDYSRVVRPRALPLYYPYQSAHGQVHLWATFSEDQVDLNYKNPEVLLQILSLIISYAKKGARFIRLDAIGFLWKEVGTSCIHLPQTHQLIQIMRYVVDQVVPGTLLVSETNVPHHENIKYFGQNNNEASLVYQFPLPPLVLFTFIKQDATKLIAWMKSLDQTPLHPKNTYFNFLASHDGIGMRPIEGILTENEKEDLIHHVLNANGKISYKNNPDGTTSPYEMNISYVDAITHGIEYEMRVNSFMASQAILLFLQGMPGIYIHSLLGTTNDYAGLKGSGINRRINRKKLNYDILVNRLKDEKSIENKIFDSYKKLIHTRRSFRAFSPSASQCIHQIDSRVVIIERKHDEDNFALFVLVNVTCQHLELNLHHIGIDVINSEKVSQQVALKAYQIRIIKVAI